MTPKQKDRRRRYEKARNIKRNQPKKTLDEVFGEIPFIKEVFNPDDIKISVPKKTIWDRIKKFIQI